MKFALINGERVTPAPKARGICPVCKSELISKCGEYMLWHWAHRSRKNCDQWWENETEWHRSWKDLFPDDWQEVAEKDPYTGEIHVADIKTPNGLVIEFQHSTINSDELISRELFYKKMIWVVDGCKNEFDMYNFSNMRSRPDAEGIANFHWFGRSTLFKRWYSRKPIFIDFGPKGFWRVLRFDLKTKKGLVGIVDKSDFASLIIKDTTDFSDCGGPASN
ncbi:competence protein CoiA [Shewanella halifaxensis]|nr:competence protein CoiA family protein [Shewanella halifaxensis]